ncbi:MAG: hypothetical protein LBP64_06140 [Tannerella sp.]|jgi:hypothetical protein|nr:hypothetical protein [Tannerella sp.]
MNRNFIYLAGLCISLFFATSCGSSGYTPDAEGFAKIQNDLQSKFGSDAYYTQVNVVNVTGNRPGSGIAINLTVTKDPASLKMEEWAYSSVGGWKQSAEVTVEVPEGTDAKEFMYQLTGTLDLKKIAELVEQSAKKLEEEKQIKGAVLDMLTLNTGNRPASSMTIGIFMQPENGGTDFRFRYDLDGNLTSFDY